MGKMRKMFIVAVWHSYCRQGHSLVWTNQCGVSVLKEGQSHSLDKYLFLCFITATLQTQTQPGRKKKKNYQDTW